jgi:hypothetical protein
MPASRLSCAVLVTGSLVALGAGALVGAGAAQAGPLFTTFRGEGTYDWTVPSGVAVVTVEAVGGSSGKGRSTQDLTAPGRSADLTATFPVTPGEVLHLHVAGNGADFTPNGGGQGGFNGGGAGGDAGGGYGGGGGGGATDIRVGGDTLADRVVVAAGGGGADLFDDHGGDAGLPAGTDGCNGIPAQPGTDTVGGAAGHGDTCSGSAGTDGAVGVGGDGAAGFGSATGGGGGGGGYFGGGGGDSFGGGAGGSSYTTPSAIGVTTRVAPLGTTPSVRISWTTPTADTLTTSESSTQLPADGTSTSTVTVTLHDAAGQPVAGDPLTFSTDDGTVTRAVDNGDGTYTTVYTAGTASGVAHLSVADSYSAGISSELPAITLTALAQTVTFDSTTPTGAGAAVGTIYQPGVSSSSGLPVALSVGSGSTANSCFVNSGAVFLAHAGTCVVEADQAGNDQYASADAVTQTITVGAASTTTALFVIPTKIRAAVSATNPNAGTPTGAVTFSVNGHSVGQAPVVNGEATITYTVPHTTSAAVSATFVGTSDYAGSTTSITRYNPTLVAHVQSRSAVHHGWYNKPVTVTFTCTTHGATLIGSCPAAVTLTRNAAHQTLTRTITATDGGAATRTVSGINIDQIAPHVQITGVRAGATYRGHAPTPRCIGTDSLSGLATCHLAITKSRGTEKVVATATDLAGNVKTVTVTFRVVNS